MMLKPRLPGYVPAFCPMIKTLILCLVLVQPRKTRPDITEKLLTGTEKIKSNKQSNKPCSYNNLTMDK